MDDQGRQNLPNLKICVDNTEEGEISDSDSSLESEVAIEVDEIVKTDNTGNAGEVEFNVRIADVGTENKTKSKTEVYTKKYENRDGDFITGIDLTSKEAIEKKEERARRFGIEVSQQQGMDADVKALYQSLGIKDADFSHGERGVRPEAIHIRGTEDMSTQDIFRYFKEFAPGGVEWIDDSSCNVVWADPTTAARAMLKMSRSQESGAELMSGDEKSKGQKKGDVKTPMMDKEEKDGVKEGGEEQGMEVDDDELDLLTDGQDEKEKKEVNKAVEEKKPSNAGDVKLDSDEDTSSKRKNKRAESTESTKEEEEVDYDEWGSINTKDSKPKHKEQVPWPPGKWRLGLNAPKAKFIFLRFATKADRKLPRAERRSKYYRKYGNPNYGGMKGLISNSRKQRFRTKTFEEELEEARDAIESQREEREARQRGNSEEEEVEEEIQLPRVSPLKRKRAESGGGSGSEDGMDMEAELQQLLGPPARKQRSMRMYADDEEEERKAKSRLGKGSGVMTVVAGARSRPAGKVTDARELIKRSALRSQMKMDKDRDSSPESMKRSRGGDLRLRVMTNPLVSDSEDEEEQEGSEEESEDGEETPRSNVMSRLGPSGKASGDSEGESDDSDGDLRARLGVHSSVDHVRSDLRSRLGGRKGHSDNSKYPSMRIEVFE
ncbi:nuclear cap-binding protein subunit 3-like [Haliotis cracherodii]|uniref:nuclear cap-binding protein subunit 3-like n=1 Tax=Haliotis cracherodii TaxID=6455 RepID=UPI0039EA9C5D